MTPEDLVGATEPEIGDRVRTRVGATGRYVGDGWVLYVSAQDNDLGIAHVNLAGDSPHPTLPVPPDAAVADCVRWLAERKVCRLCAANICSAHFCLSWLPREETRDMINPKEWVGALRERLDEIETEARKLLVTAQHTSLELQDPKLLGLHMPGWYAWPKVEKLAASVLRRVQADRRVLERHRPVTVNVPVVRSVILGRGTARQHIADEHVGDEPQTVCAWCDLRGDDERDQVETPVVYPCPDIHDLADRVGIDLPEDTDG